MRPLKLGTRGSALARRQAEIVAEALGDSATVDLVIVQTEGDRRTTEPLDAMGGEGVFVKDIERRLLAGEIDLAVHSLKDMPARDPDGLVIGAVLPRADARDALVACDGLTLAQLPGAARVGTDSRRRAAQLLALRPDLRIESIRGNVDTRIAKVAAGDYDAAVLAAAGLARLGLLDRATQVFEPSEMLPACGQGILAVQCRAGDAEVTALLRDIDDLSTRAAAEAERAFLRRLGAGCRLPVGAYAEVTDGNLFIRAFVCDDAGRMCAATSRGPASAAARTGDILAARLMMEAGIRPGAGTTP
jgi:hydroxymethylbilane synthase